MKILDFYVDKAAKYLTPVILFLPFVVMSSFYFPFITPRNFIFRILVSIILAMYLWLFFRNRAKYKPVISSVVISYLALALVMTVSSLVAGDFMYSFWSDYERMEGLLGSYYLIAFLFIILGFYYRKKAWHRLLYISLFVSYILSFIALTQIISVQFLIDSAGGDRVSSTMGNPTYLAAYALFHIFFALYLLFKDKRQTLKFELLGFYVLDLLAIFYEIKARSSGNPGMLSTIFSHFSLSLIFVLPQIFLHINVYWRRAQGWLHQQSRVLYYLLMMILNFWAMFNTQTRGALLGFFVGLVVGGLFVILAGRVNNKFKSSVLGLIIVAIIFVGTAFVFKDQDWVKNNKAFRRLSDISLSDTTAETRILTWKLSLQGWSEKPILGWGEDKFYVVFNKYFPEQVFRHPGSVVWFDRPHNIFIQHLVNGGAIGFLVYLSIYIFVLVRLFRHWRRTGDVITTSIMLAILLGYGIQNAFVFDSLNTSILFVLYLAVVTMITSRPKKESDGEASARPIKAAWLGYVLPLVVLVLGYGLNVPQLQANRDFVRQYTKLGSSAFSEAEHLKFVEIINRTYFGKFETRQVYSEYAAEVLKKDGFSLYQKSKIVDWAVQGMKKSITEQPDNVRHYAFLINLYLAAAEKLDPQYADKNIELIQQALPLSPTRTPFYYSLGRAYMIKKEPLEAIKYFEKAREISPKVFESHLNVLAGYLTIQDLDKAKEAVETIKATKALIAREGPAYLRQDYYSRIAEAYFVFRQPQEALNILEEALSLYGDVPEFLAQAIIYYVSQDNQEKVELYFAKLESIAPDIAQQVRQILEQE